MPLDQYPLPATRSPGGVHSLAAEVTTGGVTENQAIAYTIPANTLSPGTVYRIQLSGRLTASTTAATITWRLRKDSLTGFVLASPTATTIGATTAGLGFLVTAMITYNSSNQLAGHLVAQHEAAAVGNVIRGNNHSTSGSVATSPWPLVLSYQWSAAPTLMAVVSGVVELVRV